MPRTVLRRAPVAVVLALATLLAGCPRTPAAGGPKPTSRVEAPAPAIEASAVERQVEGLITRQAKAYWRAWALGAQVRLADTYRGHRALFSKATIDAVARAAQAAKTPERRLALRDLEDYLLGEHLSEALAPVNRRIADVEASALLHVGGDEVNYRDLGRLLASETDPKERATLYAAAGPVLARLAPLMKARAAKTRKVVAGLGFGSTLAFAAELRQADLDRLSKEAEAVLAGTRDVYRATLDRVATRRLGYGIERLRRADIARLFRTSRVDTAFPAKKLVPRVTGTLKAMGLAPDAGGRVTLDATVRPRKSPQPVCFPISVPGDVRVSVRPVGGAADEAALFREMGRAEAYAHVTSPVFAFQQLGGGALDRTWGDLFASLLSRRGWLSDRKGLTQAEVDHLAELRTLQRLFVVRRLAARLRFEIALARAKGTHADPAALYGTWLGRAYQFPLDAADRSRWILDQGGLLAEADGLRAAFLEAEVEAFLTRRVGPRWFADPRTGPLLTALWKDGTRLSPDDIAAKVGATRVDPSAFIAGMEARLAPSPGAPNAAGTPEG